MDFKAEVIRELSADPYFKVMFHYRVDGTSVNRGSAEVIRKYPKSIIRFDPYTDEMLSEAEKSKFELEILNALFDYLLSYGVFSSDSGKFILRTA